MFNWVLVVVLAIPGIDNGPIPDYRVIGYHQTQEKCMSAKQAHNETAQRHYVCLPVDRN